MKALSRKQKVSSSPLALTQEMPFYHLEVHILNISRIIYRRFTNDGNTHIAELNHLIQMLMGWENQHLHVFHIDKNLSENDIRFHDYK